MAATPDVCAETPGRRVGVSAMSSGAAANARTTRLVKTRERAGTIRRSTEIKIKPSTPMYHKDNLTRLKKMDELAPELMKTFWAFDKAAVADGAIPAKYKELIAIGVALTTQCPYCIDIHSGNARKAGATDAEITEAAMVAASLRAGAAVTHATHALLH
jgi:AhpD family alkylhydroperoxidase